MKDKESKIQEIEASLTLGGAVIHTWIRQSRGLRQTMPIWVAISWPLGDLPVTCMRLYHESIKRELKKRLLRCGHH